MARPSILKSSRFHGTTKINNGTERPKCKYCGKPMRIETHSKPRMVEGILEDYRHSDAYYRCGQFGCPGTKEPLFVPPSPYVPPGGTYDYEVIAKVNELRWQNHRDYKEIVADMAQQFGIHLCPRTVGDMIKLYEIGCEGIFRPAYLEKVHANGGVIIAIDAIDPLKGKKGFYTAYDALTGMPLGARKLRDGKHGSVEKFLQEVKDRVETEIGVKVLAIISDALPAQRIAVEAVFPGVPHCLCHFHFYNLVLKAPKELDSHLLTGVRAGLRKLADMAKYKAARGTAEPYVPKGSLAGEILESLSGLANWSRKPKDPCFTGLALFERTGEILEVLQAAEAKMNTGEVVIPGTEGKVIRRLCKHVSAIAAGQQDDAAELQRVRAHLAELASMLQDQETSPEAGLERLRALRDKLRKARHDPCHGKAERAFIEAFAKFVRTKGAQLFNYKRVPGAPTTNNMLELRYKQMKHFLRRVVGFAAASVYLLAHGGRLIFVDPAESYAGILEILRGMDYEAARAIINQERKARDRIGVVMHDPARWELKLKRMHQILEDLERQNNQSLEMTEQAAEQAI